MTRCLFALSDGMGFSDLGGYGGETATPALDGASNLFLVSRLKAGFVAGTPIAGAFGAKGIEEYKDIETHGRVTFLVGRTPDCRLQLSYGDPYVARSQFRHFSLDATGSGDGLRVRFWVIPALGRSRVVQSGRLLSPLSARFLLAGTITRTASITRRGRGLVQGLGVKIAWIFEDFYILPAIRRRVFPRSSLSASRTP